MDIQRIRNLTTGKLHTSMDDVYQDLERITGQTGLMTHMLPRACDAVTPWLKKHITDRRFWDGKHDAGHTGEYPLPDPTSEEREHMLARYAKMPNPLMNRLSCRVKSPVESEGE